MKTNKWELEVGGRTLTIETGKLAKQANGSCVVRYGDTLVLATATMNDEINEDLPFFPLMVEYQEKMYAAGKIKGSRFIKRETRPSDDAMLTARMIDRGIRPLFDESIRQNIQIVITVLSTDGENDPDIPAIIGTSVALHISDIPWNGPVAGIRIGKIGQEWAINPTYKARAKSVLDLGLTLSKDKILMVDSEAKEISEEVVFDAFKFSFKHAEKTIKLLEKIRKEVGKEKITIEKPEIVEEDLDKNQKASKAEFEKVQKETQEFVLAKVKKIFFDMPKASKKERKQAKEKIKELAEEMLTEKQVGKERRKKILEQLNVWIEAEITTAVLERNQRVDGRKLDQIRELNAEIGVIPRVHGSALFNRGETQVLATVTLGSPGDEQIIDEMEVDTKKRFMHHYNFPPYSVGEARPMRGAGRREIGHGALAEKAIASLLPNKEEFPYTVRAVSEVLGSNGSSSMASTCAASLALMDAGVPLKKTIAGIAIGMASEEKGKYKILTDIQDLEDGKGGMDFKVAGTRDGILAIQMDTKTDGLSLDIMKDALQSSKKALLELIDVMEKTIAQPRAELSEYAPRIITLNINPEKIRDVIGPGGKVINEIIDKTGVQIDIEQDGLVMITATADADSARAKQWVEDLTREAVVGETYTGPVVKILDFGAFVELFPGTEGMVHISEITDKERVNDINKYLKEGQQVKVKVIKIDEQGRVNLSIKKA